MHAPVHATAENRSAAAPHPPMPTWGAHGKRPRAKLKIMAKLTENILRTTKVFRFCDRRHGGPKLKWQPFLGRNSAQFSAWREWWNSPQSARWKNLEQPKQPAAAESSSNSSGGGEKSS
jgi:hypothetical protein